MLALAKLYRIMGCDQLHVGTAVGKMEGAREEVLEITESIVKDEVAQGENHLSQNWFGMKPTFPVSSGGMYPTIVPPLIEFMGKDVIIQAGGGIHGHPDGTTKGAIAMRQAVDAVLAGETLKDYAEKHEELKKALDTWGEK